MTRIALVQMNSGRDIDRNLAEAEERMEEGLRQGAEWIALPENFSFLGPEAASWEIAERYPHGRGADFLRSFARRHGVYLLGGTLPFRSGVPGKVTNTSLLVAPGGEIVARYDKIHLFDIEIGDRVRYHESEGVVAGKEVVCVDTPIGPVGLSICYDLRFPELYRELSRRGARLFFVPAAFMMETGKDHWEVLLRARAIENLAYVVAPAQFGRHGRSRISYGRSMVVDPWGTLLACAPDRAATISVEIDFEYLETVRRGLPALSHRRLP